MEVRVAIPLKDFYNGVETEFAIEKTMICEKCEGSGSADGHAETCGGCRGQGVVIQKLQVMPGMFQQVQSQCGQCGGRGKVIKKPCKTCGGQRVVKGKESYTLVVERGMPKGARISYENEGEQSPDHTAGDLIVQLIEKEPGLWASTLR